MSDEQDDYREGQVVITSKKVVPIKTRNWAKKGLKAAFNWLTEPPQKNQQQKRLEA